MRVALVNKYARVTGGSDVHCLALAAGLRDRGHEVAFISTASDDNCDDKGIFITPSVTNASRENLRGISAVRVARHAIWNPSAARATKALVSNFRPDVLHAHKLYPQLSVAPMVVASRLGVPIVQTVHDYEFISASPLDDAGSWRDREEERFSYRSLNTLLYGVKRLTHAPRIDAWISVSRSTGEAYRERGITTTVLPNFTGRFGGVGPSFEDRHGVLFIGRLSEEKGLRDVLDLPRHLSSRLPIRIAGEGPLLDEVRQATEVFPAVSYLGKLGRDDVAQELASARMVVMPSLWREPGPLAALEAMATGTPLIVYDNGGLAEYVTDATGGIAVTPSVMSLASAVTSLYDDRERWEEFSSNAREAIQRDHTLPVYLDRLEGIYSDLIERHAQS